MERAAVIARHRTALNRADLSRPFRTALADGVLGPDRTVMDYGCGRGNDLRRLTDMGFDCTGWDPVHATSGTRREADLVNLGYVVNVIESAAERQEVLRRAWSLARRVLVVAARLTDETPAARSTSPFADGVLTRIGTFQKFYDQQELRTWIDQVLEMPSVAAAPGIFYVFRDPEERTEFLATRFHRAAAAPRLQVRKQVYSQHCELLGGLARFVSDRGRLPAPEELESFGAIVEALGSLKRAFRVLQQASGVSAWDAVRKARTEDFLVFLALSRFEGRAKFAELTHELQLDVKAFFGSYAAGCKAADDLLFSLGRPQTLDEACRAARVGKLMPGALYIHTDAVAELPLLLRLYEGCARSYVGTVPGANVIKLGRGEPKISYLSYPDFERDPHPTLASSVSVHLQTFRVREHSYRDHKNPPILHRKEAFVSEAHPSKAKFARLTRLEEAKGLFDDPSCIGTRDGWAQALRTQRLALRGHRLIAVKGPLSRDSDPQHRDGSTRAFYERRAVAYAAATLKLSMDHWLRRFATRLPAGAAVIDLGCGAGRDLACLAELGMQPVGLDRSARLTAIAAGHARTPVIVGDIRALPFPDQSFAGAWASASLLHLNRAEIEPTLAEARRVLRLGGVLFVSMKQGRGESRSGDGRWFTYVEPDEFGSALTAAGFIIVDAGTETPEAALTGDRPWISYLAVRH
ncbi:DNA phosphorothioation-associated putative methyltransferase [Azospirillum sp. SYSU D00513]|uniref:class I SAM-dependent methyltransferase n=1 Tax=Azospirillum sp. SYSU D00513 TaxID=2812561 RepID=UPI0032B5156D